MPKVWLMNQACDEVLTTQLIEAIPNASLAEVQQHASHVLKMQVEEEERMIKDKQKEMNKAEEEKSKFTGGVKSRGKKKGKKGAKPKPHVYSDDEDEPQMTLK